MGSINQIEPPLVPAEMREALVRCRTQRLSGRMEVHFKEGQVVSVDLTERINCQREPAEQMRQILKRG